MASVTKTYTSSGSPDVTYRVTVTLTRVSATSIKVSVSCDTKLGSSQSLLGTGHNLVGHIWFDGKDHTWTIKKSTSAWSGSSWHENSGTSWTIAAGPTVTSDSFQLKFVNTYGSAGDKGWQDAFSVGVDSGVSYATSNHSDVKISGTANSQAKATVTLSSIPSSVGYTRVICWYKGDTYIGYTTVSATSHSGTFIGLLPNTTYKLTAKIRVGSTEGSAIATKSVSVTTPQETGTLKLTPKATYITADVSEMFNSPNYTRSIEFYVKKDESSSYTLFKTVESQGTSASANITGLISNSRYDVKVLIKNGSTTLKTLTASTETLEDTSLIPTAFIEGISQQLGTRLCTLSWAVDKSVAGTTYVIEAQAEGKTKWETLKTITSPEPLTVVEAKEGNVNTAFRISSSNGTVAEGLTNYSDEFPFYVRDDFLWDWPKEAGEPFIITANEWNRLREYAVARCADLGEYPEIPLVSDGDLVTAEIYNIMKNSISIVTPVDVADKRRGDAITADDIDALRIAINTV